MNTVYSDEVCLACLGRGRIPYYPRPMTEYDFMPEFLTCSYCCGTGWSMRLHPMRPEGKGASRE